MGEREKLTGMDISYTQACVAMDITTDEALKDNTQEFNNLLET